MIKGDFSRGLTVYLSSLDSRKLGGRGALIVGTWKCQNWLMKVSKDQHLKQNMNFKVQMLEDMAEVSLKTFFC